MLHNPFDKNYYRVYEKTYLDFVKTEIEFVSHVKFAEKKSEIEEFMRENFNVSNINQSDDLSCFYIASEPDDVRFLFEEFKITFICGHASYRSFRDSILPFMTKIVEFLKGIMQVDRVDVSLVKSNKWVANTEDDVQMVKFAYFLFNDDYLADIQNFGEKDHNMNLLQKAWEWDLSANGRLTIDRCIRRLSTGWMEFLLETKGSASGIEIDSMCGTMEEISGIQYDAFMEFTTPDAISLMDN